MPALPKVRDVRGRVGPVEIFREADARHLREPDRHVAIAAEIEENAEADRGAEQPAGGERKLREVRLPIVDGGGEVIGDDDFFQETDGDAEEAGFDVVD